MPLKIAKNAVTAEPVRQPLRIPGGWNVEHNELRQLEPSQLSEGDPLWGFFTEDLMQLRAARGGVLLDVGWYPDGDPKGSFQALLIRDQDWDHPLREFEARTLPDLVRQLEEWLLRPAL
ncbi:MAG TPA: hypothetical protein VK539_30985 [Myxococcaceae bacterium]|nr:hypothetical protein [Myxococcaceae bacterium]